MGANRPKQGPVDNAPEVLSMPDHPPTQLSHSEREAITTKMARAIAVSLGREEPNANDYEFAHKFLAAFGAIRGSWTWPT